MDVAEYASASSKITIPYNAAVNFNPSSDDYAFSFYLKNDDLTKSTYYLINSPDGSTAAGYSMYMDQ